MSAILLVVLALAAGDPEPSDSAPPAKPSVITNPDWLRRPSGEDMAGFFPAGARRKNLNGRAILSCQVKADGTLDGCSASGESPPGEGFGEAVLRMAPVFKMRPVLKDGVPVDGGTVRIPIRFVLPSGYLDPMTTVISCYGEMGARSQKKPTDEEAVRAYGFFASQFALRSAQAGTPAFGFEASLTRAREAALKGQDRVSPGLQACRDVYQEATTHPRPEGEH